MVIEQQSLLTLVRDLYRSLPFQEYHLFIVSDGSGTIASEPGGWCAVAYWPMRNEHKVFTGIMSHATNNYAELAPACHVLWYDQPKRGRISKKDQVRVLVMTDSEITAKCANGTDGCVPSKNLGLWAQLNHYKESGYSIRFTHRRRNSNQVLTYCDALAGEVRRRHKEWLDG